MQTLESKIRSLIAEHEPLVEREMALLEALKRAIQTNPSQQGGGGGSNYYSGQAGGVCGSNGITVGHGGGGAGDSLSEDIYGRGLNSCDPDKMHIVMD